MSETPKTTRRLDGLRLIGLLKIGKALLLLATTYGLYRMLNPQLVDDLHEWLGTFTDTFERRLLQRALDWLSALGHARMGGIVVVTGLYTGVLFAEGIGLWMRKIWAEWLTLAAGASLIPFELWQLLFGRIHSRLAVLVAFTLNVVIVWYLARQLRQSRRTAARAVQP